jgi:RNA-binding protein
MPDGAQVGKEGLTESVLKQVYDYLEANEIIKVKLMQSYDADTRQTAELTAQQTKAEVVATIGHKFILYKRNLSEPKLVLP